MDVFCKAMHTETNEFLNMIRTEAGLVYALTDDELDDPTFKLPRLVKSYDENDKKTVKGRYRHFKGNNYELLDECMGGEGNKFIFYKALYERDIKFFVRPYDMFFSKVDKEKYPDVKQEWRFEKIDDLSIK